MSFSLFSVVIFLLFAVILAIEIYRGIHKGVRRAMISLASGIASVVLSVMLAPPLSSLITNLVFRFIITRSIPMYQKLINAFTAADVLIQALVSIVLSTFLIVGMFFLIRAAFELIAELICKFMQKKNNGDGYREEKNSYFDQHDKVLGGIAGAISAIVVMMVITAPIMGTFDVADRIIGTVERVNTKIVNRIGENNVVAIKTFSKDFSGTVFYELGGKYIYQSAASTYMYGQKVDLINELEAIDRTVEDGMSLYRALMSSKVGTQERVGYIDELCEDVEDLNICNGLAAEVVSDVATAWINGETFYGYAMPKLKLMYRSLEDDVLLVCTEMNVDNVKPNAITCLKIYAELIESKMLYVKSSDYERFADILMNTDFLDNVNAILAQNPNMKSIDLSAMTLTAVSVQLTEVDYDQESFDVLAGNIANALNSINKKGYGTEEEKVEILASLAMKHLGDYGVTVSSDVAELTAQELLKAAPPAEKELTAEDIRAIIDEYAS